MEKSESKYVRRTQKDYSMSFKLSVVHEHETSGLSLESIQRKYSIQRSHTVKRWIEKYGNFDVSNKTPYPNSHPIQRRKIRKYQRNLPTARDKQAEILPSALEYRQKSPKSD